LMTIESSKLDGRERNLMDIDIIIGCGWMILKERGLGPPHHSNGFEARYSPPSSELFLEERGYRDKHKGLGPSGRMFLHL
jgi:hypothetical protein